MLCKFEKILILFPALFINSMYEMISTTIFDRIYYKHLKSEKKKSFEFENATLTNALKL